MSIMGHWCLLVTFLAANCHCLNIKGEWTSDQRGTKFLTAFGFQKTDPTNLEVTRGFIYGNVTSSTNRTGGYLVLVRQDLFYQLESMFTGVKEVVCSEMMTPVSKMAFERRCFAKNQQDLIRKIPCNHGELCSEEDDPDNVIKQSQFTFRIQDTGGPKFWYLFFVDCILNDNCNWTTSLDRAGVAYDIWLVNGHPEKSALNPFEHQFSFEQQDTMEMYLIAFLLFFHLTIAQFYSYRKSPLLPSAALLVFLVFRTVGFFMRSVYCVLYAVRGNSWLAFNAIGDSLAHNADVGFVLLLINLTNPWARSAKNTVLRRRYCIIGTLVCLSETGLVCLSANANVHKIPLHMLETWPGWVSMALRLFLILIFAADIRRLLAKETNRHRASFFIHYASAYMVWFVHAFGLALVAMQMSALWRFKVILGIMVFADFLSYAGLVHLLFPNSQARLYFFRQNDGDELDDFEQSLINSESR